MTHRHLPKAPPVRRFGHAPPPRRLGTLERVRRMERRHEEEERPFDPERRGSWRGSARDLVVNSRRRRQAEQRPGAGAVYDAQGYRIDLPDVKVTVERTGYELVPLRGFAHSLAVRDVNGRYIGWMPVEVTGHPSVKEWIAAEGYVANTGRIAEGDQERLRELTDLTWRHAKSVEDEEGNPIESPEALYEAALRVIKEVRKRDVLQELDRLLSGHGVEPLGSVDMRNGPPYEYINMGDTYALTVLYSRDEGTFIVSTVGDVWENGGEEKEIEDAWDSYLGADFRRAVLKALEAEYSDRVSEAEMDELVEKAEERLDEGGLNFFMQALARAQDLPRGSKYPEITHESSGVYVHNLQTVVDLVIEESKK